MELLHYIDAYCERTDPGLMAEPLNAVTNLFFFIAAYMLARRVYERVPNDRILQLLALLIGMIGLGSLSFHTYATVLTAFFDMFFISVFIAVYFLTFFKRIYGFSRLKCILGFGLFGALIYASEYLLLLVGWNTLPIYAASLITLWIMALSLVLNRHAGSRYVVTGAVLFSFALWFRTVDGPWCNVWPLGTHFLWHALNAMVLFWVAHVFIPSRAKHKQP